TMIMSRPSHSAPARASIRRFSPAPVNAEITSDEGPPATGKATRPDAMEDCKAAELLVTGETGTLHIHDLCSPVLRFGARRPRIRGLHRRRGTERLSAQRDRPAVHVARGRGLLGHGRGRH